MLSEYLTSSDVTFMKLSILSQIDNDLYLCVWMRQASYPCDLKNCSSMGSVFNLCATVLATWQTDNTNFTNGGSPQACLISFVSADLKANREIYKERKKQNKNMLKQKHIEIEITCQITVLFPPKFQAFNESTWMDHTWK